MRDRVLLPHEAADLLGMTEADLLALVHDHNRRADERNKIGTCLGGHWRFSERRLQRLREHTATAA